MEKERIIVDMALVNIENIGKGVRGGRRKTAGI